MRRALSLWQPWATFIADGLKKVETRSWVTPYRGPIAIHAALNRSAILDDTVDRLVGEAALPYPGAVSFPLGCVVAVANLVRCFKVLDRGIRVGEEIRLFPDLEAYRERWCPPHDASWREFTLGDLSAGRAAWILENVRKLPKPLPLRGKRGLWTLTEAEEAKIMEAVSAKS